MNNIAFGTSINVHADLPAFGESLIRKGGDECEKGIHSSLGVGGSCIWSECVHLQSLCLCSAEDGTGEGMFLLLSLQDFALS